MKYKLVAFDFDGTLLNDKKEISKRNLECLKKLKSIGITIVGVTARNLRSIKNVCDINLFDYLVLNNGCSIFDITNNQNKSINKLTKDIYSSIYKDVRDIAREIDFCALNNYYIINSNGYKSNSRIEISNINEVAEDVCRMNIFIDDEDNLINIKETLSKKYSNINVFLMDDKQIKDKWLVINPKNIDKSKTLEILGNVLNISMNEMMFFGDGLNDIELLKSVGLGVAMENASEDVKKAAIDVTLSNEEDGVADYLERLFTK